MSTTKNDSDNGSFKIPLTSDFVFKYVFGSKDSMEILRSLLSAVQQDAGFPAVASVQINNPFNQKDYQSDKLSVVDVRATDVTGAIYTMEAQAAWHQNYGHRGLYYWARSYGSQLSESEIYSKLRPVVGINVMDSALDAVRAVDVLYQVPGRGGHHGRSDHEGDPGGHIGNRAS